ncbi:MAG: PAS domain S-box protein [Bacteroidetes bacterium]|nr:PAS domain S-box protein [Bacteroidota bacterium]
MDLFKLLTKNSFDIISVLAADGTVKFESDAAEKILGYKPGERIGKSVFDYLHPDDKDYVFKEFSTREKKVKRLEFRFAHKNGSWVWIEAIGQDFLNDPEVNGIIVNSRDITEYKKEQQKLAKSEKGYKRLIDNSNALIMEVDADNYQIISCNQAMAKSLNHSVQNLIGKNIKDLMPPEVLKKRIEYGNKALELNTIQQFEDERDGRRFMNHFIPYTDQERRYVQTITYEITEHWKTEKALSESETKYKELFQFLEEGFLRADKNGIITMANNSIAILAGYESPEEMIGLSMNKLYAIPSERSKMIADLKEKGVLKNYKVRLTTKDGDIRWTSCNIKFYRDQNNEITGTEGLIRDITEQKRLEEKLLESQQRFKNFMDHIPGAAFLKDKDNKLLYCNQEYASMLGTTPENLLNEDLSETIPENLQRIYFQENEDIIKKGKLIVSESEFTAEKRLKNWLTYKFPVSVQNETFIGAISIDITSRRQAEQALKESEEKFKTIFNMALSMICIADINTATFKVINPSFSRTLGYTEQELLSKPFLDFVHPDDKESTIQIIEKALKAGKTVIHFENRYRCKNGTYRWIEWNSHPVVDKGITYAIAYDITERKEAELALKEINTKLTTQNIAFESSIDGIAILNEKQEYTYLNQAHAEIYGYSAPEELMNKSWKVLYDKDELKRFEDKIMPKLIEKGFWSGEAIGLKKQGKEFYQNISLTRLENGGFICIVRDITVQKQVEIALQESEERYRTLIDSITDSVYVLDRNWNHVIVNDGAAKFTGFSKKNLLNNNLLELFSGIEETVFFKKFKKVMQKRIPDTVQEEFVFPSGEKGWYEVNIYPVSEGILCISKDITERKIIESNLKESEERFRNIFNFSPTGISITNMKGEMSVNETFCRILGYTAEELKVKFTSITHPDDVEMSFKYFDELRSGKKDHVEFEKRYIHKNGTAVWVNLVITLFKENNIPKYFITSMIDITDRKKAEHDLVKSQDNLSYLNQSLSKVINIDSLDRIYKYMADSVHLLYPGSVVLYAAIDETGQYTINKAFAGLKDTYVDKIERIIGFKLMDKRYRLQERYKNLFISGNLTVHDETFAEFTKGTFASLAAKAVQKLLGIKKIYTIGVNWEDELLGFLTIFNTKSYEQVEKVFIENYVTHMAAVIRNKKINDQLQRSEAQYRELNATKDKFFSIISHDLKAPFNSILGFSKLINKKIKNNEYEKVNTYCDFINKSAQQSYDLLDNLLQWSRIQTGRMDFSPEKIKIKESIDAALILLSPNYKAKKIDITNEVSKNLEVYADQFMIDTVFRNLISNAIKFTHNQGKITIRDKQQHNKILIEVEDDGIGIQEKDIKDLFNIENTYSKEGTNEEKGTGLGLILCKEFIEKHGGEIWVQSKEGDGTKFFFTIPKVR